MKEISDEEYNNIEECVENLYENSEEMTKEKIISIMDENDIEVQYDDKEGTIEEFTKKLEKMKGIDENNTKLKYILEMLTMYRINNRMIKIYDKLLKKYIRMKKIKLQLHNIEHYKYIADNNILNYGEMVENTHNILKDIKDICKEIRNKDVEEIIMEKELEEIIPMI